MRRLPPILLASLAFFSSVAAQETTHPVQALTLDADLGWLDDGAVFLDHPGPKRRMTREEARVDRGELIDEAIARAAKEAKLVLWYVPRISEGTLHGVQMYRAPVLDAYMRQVVFCDADVRGIVASAFVPVRAVCDEELAERFGLRPLEALEPALVFLDGEGKVVHLFDHVRTFNAHWFASLFARVLAAGGIEPPADASVEELTARGSWDAALAKLERGEGSVKAEERALREGSLLRRLRRADEARAKLVWARDCAGATRATVESAELELGLLALQTGDRAAARGHLERAGGAEAEYLLGWASWADGDDAAARGYFERVVAEFPGTLGARRARTNLTLGPDRRPLGATFSGYEGVEFLPDAAYVGLPRDTRWAGDVLAPRELALRGVRFLLEMQRKGGGFEDARYAYWPNPAITPNTWVAISALALTALLEYREVLARDLDLLELDEALARGERYLLDPSQVNRGENEEVYADAFRLLFLVERVRRAPTRRPELVGEMESLIAAAREYQSGSGFFAHEYPNAFCTAAMLWALLEAREVGAGVPEEMLRRGAGALTAARSENGAYAYGGSAFADGSLKDSAGRMPICEAVLLRCGSGSPARLEAAVDNFWEHLDRLRRVQLNDFHSDGELAGFFFFHDVYLTSEAVRFLPEARRDESAARLVTLLQELPELDGSFLDSHEFGRSYGTAMALLALRWAAHF